MRSVWTCAVVASVLSACGGPQVHQQPDWWEGKYLGFLDREDLDGYKGPQAIVTSWIGEPVDIAVVSKPTPELRNVELLATGTHQVLARVANATGVHLHEKNWLALEVKSSPAGKPSWVIAVFDSEYAKELKAMSPPLVGIRRYVTHRLKETWKWELGQTWAVDAGNDSGLVIPLAADGALAPLPDGALGAKPVIWDRPDYNDQSERSLWVGWLIKLPNGWMLSTDEHAADLSPTTPLWKDVQVYALANGASLIVCGARATGIIHDVSASPSSAPQLKMPMGMGSSCDTALQDLDQRYHEMVQAEDASVAAERERDAQEAAQEPIDQRRYVEALAAAGNPSALPESACNLARSFTPASHTALMLSRVSVLLDGELDCFLGRHDLSYHDYDTVKMQAIYAQRAQWTQHQAAQRAQEDREFAARRAEQESNRPGPGYSIESGPHDGRGEATERQIQAQEAYSHGSGGLCPFADRSYCH